MWSQPTPTNAGFRLGFATSLAPGDWALLVRLPSRVLAAVLAVPIDPPPVSAGLAGLATIAHARVAPAGLVREVATAIFATVEPPADTGYCVQDECVRAGFVLAQRVPSAEAEAYRAWVRRVGEAAAEPMADDPVGTSQACLLDDFEQALAG
ncbi:hypothetical protein [Virgisporangium aurantiacum]|uniref:Uncharacterized protein n=1 Tax=Virgisporangium aurantiacum TaxID=175570 RepID=A0A8J3YXA2_9ACTN|nr:hypothetical protein [Virgisporangium aurantiacum]GIJ53674.1 hypothetical protein Vau01_011900 [Virgisporangium aurantiacum]